MPLTPSTICAIVLACVVVGCTQQTDSDIPMGGSQPSGEQVFIEPTTNASGNGPRNGQADQNATIQLFEVPVTATGVEFQHVSGNSKQKPFPAANGSGMGMIRLRS